ncbi:MAG: cupin domain-containing protein [Bacteroidetes bacterium]|nr:cupin domain-containing protein [Bacteroidota bacterium]MCH8523794.1 cupin domain-containing protein [Balneolales bacterium]
MKNNSRVISCVDYNWEDVEKKDYKTDTTNFKDISRFSLLGEDDRDYELNMQTRYFEIKPGGYSSLEFHRHPHSVVIIRGKGTVILNDRITDIGLHDVVFISPETVHQFQADKGEYLGFICIVDRYRDKPAIPDEATIDKYVGSDTAARKKIRL